MKTILLRPKEILDEPFSRVFEPLQGNRGAEGFYGRGWLFALRDVLREKGYDFKTIDLGDWDTIRKAEKILIMGFHNDEYYRRCLDESLEDKMVYFEVEFRVNKEGNETEGGYAPATYTSAFGKVLTWEKDIIDNKRVFYIQRPNNWYKGKLSNLPFQDRKLCVMAYTNKDLQVRGELYSERKRAILFFQEQVPTEFDLYGTGWTRSIRRYIRRKLGMNVDEQREFHQSHIARFLLGEKDYSKCWQGWADNVYDTYSRYKFVVIYENVSARGAVSNKLFDCLQAGCVPIYLGATDIEDIVPLDCFVDKRKYSYEELLHEIMEMSEEDWGSMIECGKTFLASKAGRRHFEKDWAREFVEVLLK